MNMTYTLHHEEARSFGHEEQADSQEGGGEELDSNERIWSALPSQSHRIQTPHTCTITGNCHWNLLDAQLQETRRKAEVSFGFDFGDASHGS
jgi:hypothetical protein